MGKPVVIPKEDQEKMKEMFKINQFNLMASEMIALNRSLPDVRLEGWVPGVVLIVFNMNESMFWILSKLHFSVDCSWTECYIAELLLTTTPHLRNN